MMLLAGLLLCLKHFIADGPLQYPYMYLNKGKFGHPGGIAHAGVHGALTTGVLLMAGVDQKWGWIGVVDAIVHYFIDLVKVKMTAKYKWFEFVPGSAVEPTTTSYLKITSDWYFYALIADQCLHFATYVVILAVVFK